MRYRAWSGGEFRRAGTLVKARAERRRQAGEAVEDGLFLAHGDAGSQVLEENVDAADEVEQRAQTLLSATQPLPLDDAVLAKREPEHGSGSHEGSLSPTMSEQLAVT